MELGLHGFARNLEDGRVEVYATGLPEKLNELRAALHIGPRMADVRHVDERDDSVKNFASFSVR